MPLITKPIDTKTIFFFKCHRNDTGSGLRMKIAAVSKIPHKKLDSHKTTDTNVNQKPLNKEQVGTRANKTIRNMSSKKQRNESISNSSCCSGCTESDDDSDSSSVYSKNKINAKSMKLNANNKLQKNGGSIRRNVLKRTKKPNIETSDSNSDSNDESGENQMVEKRTPLPNVK